MAPVTRSQSLYYPACKSAGNIYCGNPKCSNCYDRGTITHTYITEYSELEGYSSGYINPQKLKTGVWTYYNNEHDQFPYKKITYHNGKKYGNTTRYYENSSIVAMIGNYVNDKEEGIWRYYDIEGFIVYSETLKNGFMNGFLTIYHFKSDVVKTVKNFKDDHLDGLWYEYNEQDVLIEERYYSMDIKVGHWKFFDDKGKLMKEIIYHN
jgi:antitoxin component YwqK of YwqJK toxin-antitoxin module